MKPRQLTWKWLLLAAVALVIAGLLVLPREFEPPSVVRDRIAAVLSAWTGATVTLTEPLSVRYYPPLSLRGGLVLTNATKLPSVSAITARDVKISLDPLELFMGRIKVDGLRLAEPNITLKENAASAALIADALADVPVGAVRIRRGTIKTASGEKIVSDLDVRLAASDGALTAMGSLDFRGETVAFAVDSGALSDTDGEPSAPVTISVTSKPMTARFSGTARYADGLELDGDVKATMADARRFLNWVGVALPEGKSLKGLSASGTAHWSGSTLTFDDGTFSLDGNEADGLLALTAGERPRIEGTLAFERLVLDPYLGESEVAPQGAPFDWALLKYFDADLRISAGQIAASSLELGGGGFTISAKGGVISTEVGELELCGGEAAGRMGLDLSGKRVRASLVGDLSDITLETCLQPLALGVPLKGVGTLKLDVSTGGKTRDELIRGLVGEFQVAAQNGAVPVDLPQLVAGADPKGTGWSHQSVTPFQTLDADCRLSAGHIWCQSFSMETTRGVVSGSGGVDVGKQTLDWDFLIANPVAPLSASQLVMEMPPRVIVRGPLTQPLIQRANRPTLGDESTQANPGTSSASPR